MPSSELNPADLLSGLLDELCGVGLMPEELADVLGTTKEIAFAALLAYSYAAEQVIELAPATDLSASHAVFCLVGSESEAAQWLRGMAIKFDLIQTSDRS
jgi:hypothetical protein